MAKRDGERTRWTDEMLDGLADSVSELRESVSELRESVLEVKDFVEGVRIAAKALLEKYIQQQRENEAMSQRQGESEHRFDVLLSEIHYLIRQIYPEDRV